MSNTANINRLIEVLKRDDGKHFRMGGYNFANPDRDETIADVMDPKTIHTCGSAFCVAGWVNTIRMFDLGDLKIETDQDWIFEDTPSAAAWLGIDEDLAEDLFVMENAARWNMGKFDHELTPELRRDAAIAVLEHLRDTGGVDWDRAIGIAMLANKRLPASITDLLKADEQV